MPSRSDRFRVIRMVAVEKTIAAQTLDEETLCPECLGTGTISHWSEIAYFEDRRSCARCDAGGRVATRIADIVKRARLEDRLSGN